MLARPLPFSFPFSLPGGPTSRRLAAELALGGLYWAAFLLALEPGNAVRAAGAGHPLPVSPEAARIVGASLLGAGSAPVMLALARRFPVTGRRPWRNGAVQAAGVAALAVGLVAASCVLAGLGDFDGSADVPGELVRNGPLVAFCLAGLAVAGQAFQGRPRERRRDPAPPPTRPFLSEIAVKTRGGVVIVPLDEIDWIETQGNYLALHSGARVHLLRETSVGLERQLDPRRFARVHRRTLVALDRVRELRPLGGGDGELRLADGARLRLSRSYRGAVQSRLQGRPIGPPGES